ncbi:hypothetical protein [Nocardia crassostreae]|uniref:hypothetical protein n=1 Tax=Nocardia crassostreae TaxID=53428 RepID=UPI0008341EC5|nr:hypothetical protein [Nocardia crassostreae]
MNSATTTPVFAQIITTPEVTPARYDAVNVSIGSAPIAGNLLSAAGFDDAAMTTLDVWDSRAAARRFVADRLIPAFERTGNIPEPYNSAVEFDGRMTVSAAPPARVHLRISRIP